MAGRDNTDLNRSISPLIDADIVYKSVMNELDILVDPNSKKTWDADGVRDMLKPQLISKTEYRIKYGETRDSKRDMKNQLEAVTRKARIAEFILGFRSLLDFYERTYFPAWLREYVFDHIVRWRIMFKIEGNSFVQIMKLRMENGKIQEEDFFMALDLFRAKMNMEYHEGDTPKIETEEEWKAIFDRLNIKGYPNEESLKILNIAITQEENDLTWKRRYSKKSVPAALYMKGLPFEYDEGDVKQFLGKDESIVTNITILTRETENRRKKSTGEAIVFICSIEEALHIYGSKNGHAFLSSKLSINNPYTLA